MLSVLSTLGPKGVSQLGWRELESASQAAAGLKQAGYSDHDVALWLRAFYTAGTRHEMLSVWRLFDEQGRGAVSAGHLENRLVDVYGEEARETIVTTARSRKGSGRGAQSVHAFKAPPGAGTLRLLGLSEGVLHSVLRMRCCKSRSNVRRIQIDPYGPYPILR